MANKQKKVFQAPMWRRRQIAKAGKGRSESGKNKGENCQTNPTKKFFFTHPHAHRHPNYLEWHGKAKKANKVEAGAGKKA